MIDLQRMIYNAEDIISVVRDLVDNYNEVVSEYKDLERRFDDGSLVETSVAEYKEEIQDLAFKLEEKDRDFKNERDNNYILKKENQALKLEIEELKKQLENSPKNEQSGKPIKKLLKKKVNGFKPLADDEDIPF